MRCKPYCAYGSNLNIEQMTARCPNAKLIGSGVLHGYRLVFKYHADIIPDKESCVPVALWEVTEDDTTALDMYEGSPNYYKTISVSVDMDGKLVYAFAYVMQDNFDVIELPTESYYDVIRQGYIDNGLDLEYLIAAFDEAI